MKSTSAKKTFVGGVLWSAHNSRPTGIPLLGGRMIPINQAYFYNLSTKLHPLVNLQASDKLTEIAPILYDAQGRLDSFLRNQDIPVHTCLNSGGELARNLQGIVGRIADNEELGIYGAYVLKDSLSRFETILTAELDEKAVYYVSQKGGYDTATLIENGEAFLPIEIRLDMTDESLLDFKQGCRCLAFELPTAAGFHFLRTTESVVRDYYDAMTDYRERPTFRDNQPAAMGTFIAEAERHGNCDPKVIGTLRQLNTLHRHSLIHPEDVLSMTQAIILFGMVISAIAAMISEMQAKEEEDIAASSEVSAIASPVPAPPVSVEPQDNETGDEPEIIR